MSQSLQLLVEQEAARGAEPDVASSDILHGHSPVGPCEIPALTSNQPSALEEAGGSYVPPVQDRFRFETLLADLSATFVNLSASQVDSQIESALQRLVEFLDVDRGGLAEVLPRQKQLVITHSYHMPGVPLLPRIIVDEQLPWYAKTIQEGEVLRLARIPEELPPEAVLERAYCTHVGLKSHVMIPLKVVGFVAGAIGFGSFRGYRDWPEDLIQRLRLVGEIFTNALARKRADEALRASEQSLRQTREGLRKLAAKLLRAQEEERRRIAREMHDDWTQRLALLGIDLAKSAKEVAAGLKISVRTAEAHRAHIMEVLGLHTTAELVQYALRNGIISV